MFKRYLSDRLPKKSFFLFGPRQVGKSTILSTIPTQLTLDLLNPDQQLQYNKTPNLLADQIAALPQKKGTVLIDEVQHVPKLLNIVHASMEKYPALQFIMSGSSARKLRHGAANLLGGRALYRSMYPLTFSELGDSFQLGHALAHGTLPKIWTTLMDNDVALAQDLLRAYVTTYVREEIKAEALVRNLEGFQNFLDIAAAQFSEQVNLSDVGRDCGVAYSTVREFYSILEDTLMGFFLRPCIRSERKRMSQSPKFYFFDNGVTRALIGALRSPVSPLDAGRLFEQWVIQEVMRFNGYRQMDWKLLFWRTSNGAEVDLVIEQGTRLLCAIECKHKRTLSNSDLSGIHAFQESHPKVPCYIVANIAKPQQVGNVRAISYLDLPELLEKL